MALRARWWVVAASFLVAAPAAGADVFVHEGLGAALPLSGDAAPVIHTSVGLLFPVGEEFELGGRLRFLYLPTLVGPMNLGLSLMALGRRTLEVEHDMRMWAGVGAGLGGWAACFRGDYCGGGGLVGAVEAGVEIPFAGQLAVEVSTGLGVHTGLVNGVQVLILPNISFGLRY